MKYFDCFSGIGGFTLGIEKATNKEWECIGYSEIDKYASSIYTKHFPKHRNFGDITRIRARELPDFDLFTFGFPCQDLSIAGKRRGLEGVRSGLFFEAVRIINEKRPSYIIFENVKGLFSSNEGKDFELVLRTIADIGYDGQWQLLNTSWFLPQNRERIYFVGHLRGKRRPEIFPIGENAEVFSGQTRKNNQQAGDTETQIGRTINSRIAKMGDADNYVKLCVAQRGRENGQQLEPRKDGLTNSLTSVEKDNYVVTPCLNPNDLRKGYSGQNKQFLKSTGMIRRLTPVECERLQGFPDGWTKLGVKRVLGCFTVENISDSQRYKCLGNAVSVPVVEAVIRKLL